MKTLSPIILPILILTLSSSISVAQDYKHPFGLVDKKKSTTNHSTQKEPAKGKLNYVSTNGKLINPETGEEYRHIGKNEPFTYYFKKTPPIQFKYNNKCAAKGVFFYILHENYKHPGICNYHCIQWYKKD